MFSFVLIGFSKWRKQLISFKKQKEMAVNRIILRDGKKVCIPIKTRAEYYKLRDADFNRKSAEKARNGETFTTRSGEQKSYKTILEQFNYSLTTPTPSCPSGILPRDGKERLAQNREFPLKGANCVGNSVGMDVDFHVPEQLPEGVTAEKWVKSKRRKSGSTREPA